MHEHTSVLGLSIGTRKIGAAVITRTHLDCARVWVLPGKWDEKKLQAIMRKVQHKVRKYQITRIALKVPKQTHHTIGIRQVIAELLAYCSRQQIALRIYTIAELKSSGVEENRKNKRLLVQSLGNKYPLLYYKARKELSNRHAHHTKLFEAVASAELLLE